MKAGFQTAQKAVRQTNVHCGGTDVSFFHNVFGLRPESVQIPDRETVSDDRGPLGCEG